MSMDRQHDFTERTDRDGANREPELSANDAAVEAPPVIGTDERRMHVRAYNYWVSMLNGRNYPSVEDLELDNRSDFGPHSVLLDFTHAGDTPGIAWLGERLSHECNLPADVASVADVPPRSLLSRLTDHHLQIIANRAPIGFEAEFRNTRGNNTMYRGILLPFSSDNETIDFIYGVINWKEVADAETVAALQQEVAQSVAGIAPRAMVPVWADGPGATGIASPPRTVDDLIDDAEDDSHDTVTAIGDGETLAAWLDAARAQADAALTADTRGRAALYKALAGAYDFALIAETRADEYAALLADAKIRVQERAPMTPVAKLIFGRDYDKTRLTEFAAALSFARRRELPSGGMKLFLETYPGGLKAIVAAERRERRPDDKPIKPDLTRLAARNLPEQAYLTLSGSDEFVVLVARRVDTERVAIIGVVGDDKPLLDRALKHIVE